MIINHNIAAINTHRQMGSAQSAQMSSMEKLSSGLRINSAKDDAAGLTISEKMRGQIRGLEQATRNSQDAISMIQTAEGALSETTDILQRMREVSTQAANGTLTETDRGALQDEMNQLTSEINRIGSTTEFNSKKLLNGDLSSNKMISAAVTTPATSVDVVKASAQTIKVGAEPISWTNNSTADFNVGITGKADNGFDWASLDPAGTNELTIAKVGDAYTVTFNGTDSNGKTLTLDSEAVSFNPANNTFSYDNQGISFAFTTEDAQNWADTDSVTINLNTIGTDATGSHGTVAENVPLSVDGGTNGDASAVMTPITVNGNGLLLEGVDRMDIAWDEATEKFTATLFNGITQVSKSEFSLAEGEKLTYNADGISFDFTATGDTGGTDGKLSGSFALKTETVTVETAPAVTTAAVFADQSTSFQIGANQNQELSLSFSDMRAAALGITGSGAGYSSSANVTNGTDNVMSEKALDMTTKEGASSAITTIDAAIATVSSERSKLGATQNRLNHTINNLNTSAENLTAAESRIRDVDMAKEMMNQTRNSILAQASQAMLAQANQAPQAVLQLLR